MPTDEEIDDAIKASLSRGIIGREGMFIDAYLSMRAERNRLQKEFRDYLEERRHDAIEYDLCD